jgi:hypothetical protein
LLHPVTADEIRLTGSAGILISLSASLATRVKGDSIMARSASLVAQTVIHDGWGPVRTFLSALLFACIAAVFIVESI